jgi:nickel-dependent lactate racemase
MMLFEKGSPTANLSLDDLREGICASLDKLGSPKKILIIPPDITRLQSHAGDLTRFAYEYMPEAVGGILPALGTHRPMTKQEIETMFGAIPQHLFRPHHWRTDCTPLGEVPGDQIPVSFNQMIFDRMYDCILSISQVVPHEVAGMAGYSKNIVVGLGGPEIIHKTHFLGAAYGMERIMGRADSPVRKVLDYIYKKFFGSLPVVHAVTVIGMDASGSLKVRGLFIGNDNECYARAAELSRTVNIYSLDKPLKKVVVYLDPVEYKSTWLGNKSIYRTRMALADGGELIVIAPGVKMFGEDKDIDRLIRQFGYRGTPAVMHHVVTNDLLKNNLSAAAHLIHGSSEGRFSITYCTGGLSKEGIERVGFRYAQVREMLKRYNPKTLSEGMNTLPDGEEVFFISNPGQGLWTWKEKFK